MRRGQLEDHGQNGLIVSRILVETVSDFIQAKYTLSRFTCPKNAVLFGCSFQAVHFFSADSSRKKGFQPVKSPYFCVGQQKKKKKNRLKRTSKGKRAFQPVNSSFFFCVGQQKKKKRTAILGHVNRLSVLLNWERSALIWCCCIRKARGKTSEGKRRENFW